jgi:hypothetical protein
VTEGKKAREERKVKNEKLSSFLHRRVQRRIGDT